MNLRMAGSFLAGLIVFGVAQAGAAPLLKFDNVVYDFGKTQGISTVTGTFTFQNDGDAELQIRKPAPTCGCTVAAVKPETLAPGAKGELVFSLNVGSSRGVVQKHIAVPSNDPVNPTLQLTIRVDVVQMYEITPQFFALGDLTPGTTTNVTVTVKRMDGKPLQLVSATASSEFVHTKIAEVEGSSGHASTVNIEFVAGGELRRFNEQINLLVEGQTTPISAVNVQGRIVGELAVTPERLVWGIGSLDRIPAARLETMLTRSVRITASKPGESLQLKNPVSTLKDLNVELVTLETGKTYMVVAKLSNAPKESEQGIITIDTNLPSQPQLQVPVSINVIQRR